jgi:hypothetical protein
MIANLCGSILFALGCVLILVNGVVAYRNLQNRRQGIERHVSSIVLIPQFLMVLSAVSFHTSVAPWIAGWILLLVALSDPILWIMAFQTIVVIAKRPRRNQN